MMRMKKSDIKHKILFLKRARWGRKYSKYKSWYVYIKLRNKGWERITRSWGKTYNHVSDKRTLTILMTRQKWAEWSTQLHLLIIQSVHRRLESTAYDCWSWNNDNVEAFVEYLDHNNGSDIWSDSRVVILKGQTILCSHLTFGGFKQHFYHNNSLFWVE